jgi:hypothetical protein
MMVCAIDHRHVSLRRGKALAERQSAEPSAQHKHMHPIVTHARTVSQGQGCVKRFGCSNARIVSRVLPNSTINKDD